MEKFSYMSQCKLYTSNYGHMHQKAPDPVRSPKLNWWQPCQYCGGRPRGNTACCSFFYLFFSFIFLFELVFSFFFSKFKVSFLGLDPPLGLKKMPFLGLDPPFGLKMKKMPFLGLDPLLGLKKNAFPRTRSTARSEDEENSFPGTWSPVRSEKCQVRPETFDVPRTRSKFGLKSSPWCPSYLSMRYKNAFTRIHGSSIGNLEPWAKPSHTGTLSIYA